MAADEFAISAEFGRGHFGAVHSCMWRERRVCVKRLIALAGADAGARSLLSMQIKAFALSHEVGDETCLACLGASFAASALSLI